MCMCLSDLNGSQASPRFQRCCRPSDGLHAVDFCDTVLYFSSTSPSLGLFFCGIRLGLSSFLWDFFALGLVRRCCWCCGSCLRRGWLLLTVVVQPAFLSALAMLKRCNFASFGWRDVLLRMCFRISKGVVRQACLLRQTLARSGFFSAQCRQGSERRNTKKKDQGRKRMKQKI